MTQSNELPIQTVLAAAIKAHETNDGFIGSRDFSPKPRNSRLMSEYFEDLSNSNLDKYTDQAEAIIAYCQTKMLELISGNLTPYWQGILDAVNRPTVSKTDFKNLGLLASVPQAYYRSIARDEATEKRESASVNSQYFGNIGDKVELVVEIISKIFSVKYGRHFYTGITAEGNLVNFPGGDDLNIGTKVPMSARVRKHVDQNTTMLNYVKVKVDKKA